MKDFLIEINAKEPQHIQPEGNIGIIIVKDMSRLGRNLREGLRRACKIMEDIADYTELSLNTIKELANQSMQSA